MARPSHWVTHGARRPQGSPKSLSYLFTSRSAMQVSTMILPQVHLRKPCYDFSFLYMIWFSELLATSPAANRPRRRDPNTSPDHSIGRSDGRCVQRAGT